MSQLDYAEQASTPDPKRDALQALKQQARAFLETRDRLQKGNTYTETGVAAREELAALQTAVVASLCQWIQTME